MSFYISAAHKSSGKTTVSLGLCAALVNKGLIVQTFKKGPDFIDPIWLSRAANRPCLNLDFYTSSEKEISTTFESYSASSDIQIIEGNKGLYDGLSVTGSDSNAAMAKLLGSQVILVLDTQGITRGIAPLLRGYSEFDRDVDIAGVILNNVAGERHESKLVEAVERYTDLTILGAIRRFSSDGIEERHLGLVPANEDKAAGKKIQRLGELVAEQVDLDIFTTEKSVTNPDLPKPLPNVSQKIKIAIAKDAAFGFYYQDDLDAFETESVELVEFSPINDETLPQVDGLFLGGGFPERHMEALDKNKEMRQSIFQAVEDGLPTYAECGGLMYLTSSITWRNKTAAGVGVISAETIMQSKPQGRGYMQLKETAKGLWPGGEPNKIINAHEFHYSHLDGLPADTQFAYEVTRGCGIENQKDGIIYKNLLANYAHLRDVGDHHWVQRFVAFVRQNTQ